MFPYDEKPISRIRTSLDIEKFGRQSLLRALNIGRVVAFIGSGASLQFGQPKWSELKEQSANLFSNLEECVKNSKDFGKDGKHEKEYKATLGALSDEIKEVRNSKSFDTIHFVRLCENYFEEVDGLLKKYGLTTDEFSCASPLPPTSRKAFREDFANRFKSVVFENEKQTLRQSDQITRVLRTETLKLNQSVIDELEEIKDVSRDIEEFDGSRALLTELDIRRFLTLNYDLEIERMLLEETRSAPFASHKQFMHFVNDSQQNQSEAAVQHYDRGAGRAVYLKSASGRVMRSTSSNQETLADLFAFGAFPTNYDASVHHLHGRLDDPENMIITSQDYQNIYYGKSEQKKSFDEARHAVFTGSDLLVVGMGHGEADVLKPLRDFLELETNRKDAHGVVYYLTSSKLSGEEDPKQALESARSENLALTQELYQTYGMHTIFIDHSFSNISGAIGSVSNWPDGSAEIFSARAELAHYRLLCDKKMPFVNWRIENLPEKYTQLCLAIRGDQSSSVEEFREVIIARKFMEDLKNNGVIEEKPELDNEERNEAIKIIDSLEQRLRSRGIVLAIKALRKERNQWWRKWSTKPGIRWPVFGQHYYKFSDAVSANGIENKNRIDRVSLDKFEIDTDASCINKPLVWRTSNLDCNFGNKPIELGNIKSRAQFSNFLSATCEARIEALKSSYEYNKESGRPTEERVPDKYPAAIVRLSMAPGSGKGRLISFFTNKQKICCFSSSVDNSSSEYPFQFLFQKDNLHKQGDSLKKNPNVVGCFAAHLTFTMEFTSTITGLTRFLQLHLVNLRNMEFPEGSNVYQDKRWNQLLSLSMYHPKNAASDLEILGKILSFLIDVCPAQGWSCRVVVFLSYLEQLVDENGDAHSPIHREFFRMISGWNNSIAHSKLPIDFVFINSHADKPIRYLSIEKPIAPDADRRSEEWQGSMWKFRHDRGRALKYWTPLGSVVEKNLIEEALYFSATLSPDIPAEHKPSDLVDAILQIVPPHDDYRLPDGLRVFTSQRVVYGFLMAGLAVELYAKASREAARERVAEEFLSLWEANTDILDAAYTRGSTQGLINSFFSLYRRLDKKVDSSQTSGTLIRNKEGNFSQESARLVALVVDHLALFSYPVTADTLARCPEIFELLNLIDSDGEYTVLLDVLKKLVSRGFVSRFKTVNHDEENLHEEYTYVLHTVISSSLRSSSDLSVYGHYSLVPFQPSLFSEQSENSIKPEASHFKRVSEVVRALVKDTHSELVDISNTTENICTPEYRDCLINYGERLRSAYALIRGTFSLSVVSRLGDEVGVNYSRWPYDEYRTWMRKLLNTTTLLTKVNNQYRRCGSKSNILELNEPFYRGEIAWLYNERALVSFVQGRLFDGLPLFDQALEVLGTTVRKNEPVSHKATRRRIALNQALAQMERGKIKRATDIFSNIIEETSQRWISDTPSTLNCYARGYLALCKHLTDDFASAKAGYLEVLGEMEELGFTRGQSIFRRHYGDLLRTMSKSRNDKDFLEAIDQLKSSEELAMGIRATDLQNYTLIAQARLHRDMHRRPEALEKLRRSEEFSRKMGLQKMMTEVLKVRGEVLLAEGEATQAGVVTAQSIAMAKRNGMRLRKISSALIQSEILSIRNQKKDAARLLREILVESQSLGYATKTSAAIKLLSKIS